MADQFDDKPYESAPPKPPFTGIPSPVPEELGGRVVRGLTQKEVVHIRPQDDDTKEKSNG